MNVSNIGPVLLPTAGCGLCCLAWLLFCQFLSHQKILNSAQTRKFIHIGTGFVFAFTWGFFPIDNQWSRFFAASIPAIVTLQFSLIGFGIINDKKTVNSMSRTGNPRELLLGPASYGVIFVVSLIVYWLHSPIGITALSMLFVGDGFAGLVGQEVKSTKLFHNKSKTVAGTLAFIVSSIMITPILLHIVQSYGYLVNFSIAGFIPSLVLVTLICAAVESIPLEDWDNITVFLTCVGTLTLLGWT